MILYKSSSRGFEPTTFLIHDLSRSKQFDDLDRSTTWVDPKKRCLVPYICNAWFGHIDSDLFLGHMWGLRWSNNKIMPNKQTIWQITVGIRIAGRSGIRIFYPQKGNNFCFINQTNDFHVEEENWDTLCADIHIWKTGLDIISILNKKASSLILQLWILVIHAPTCKLG